MCCALNTICSTHHVRLAIKVRWLPSSPSSLLFLHLLSWPRSPSSHTWVTVRGLSRQHSFLSSSFLSSPLDESSGSSFPLCSQPLNIQTSNHHHFPVQQIWVWPVGSRGVGQMSGEVREQEGKHSSSTSFPRSCPWAAAQQGSGSGFSWGLFGSNYKRTQYHPHSLAANSCTRAQRSWKTSSLPHSRPQDRIKEESIRWLRASFSHWQSHPLARGAHNFPGLGFRDPRGMAGFSDQEGAGMIPFLSCAMKCVLFSSWSLIWFKGCSG